MKNKSKIFYFTPHLLLLLPHPHCPTTGHHHLPTADYRPPPPTTVTVTVTVVMPEEVSKAAIDAVTANTNHDAGITQIQPPSAQIENEKKRKKRREKEKTRTSPAMEGLAVTALTFHTHRRHQGRREREKLKLYFPKRWIAKKVPYNLHFRTINTQNSS